MTVRFVILLNLARVVMFVIRVSIVTVWKMLFVLSVMRIVRLVIRNSSVQVVMCVMSASGVITASNRLIVPLVWIARIVMLLVTPAINVKFV